jgi:hypothetical protein
MITLHPKFGVNPTLGICIFCGEDDGTIGLLGANRGREAPRRSVISTTPCAKCKALMAQGITLLEAQHHKGDCTLELRPGVHFTGRWIVMKSEAVERIFHEDARDQMLRHGKAFLEPSTYARILELYAAATKDDGSA